MRISIIAVGTRMPAWVREAVEDNFSLQRDTGCTSVRHAGPVCACLGVGRAAYWILRV